jgi:hypothetical protein
MASSINASTTAGVVTTADTSGVLNLQTAGTTAIAIDASQAVTVQGLTVGKGAGAVSTNTVVGTSALQANTTGAGITAVGYQAGYTNSTGGYNVFIGYWAGYTSNYNGNAYNVCVGWASGYSLTTGIKNTFIGGGNGALAAGGAVTTGSSNVIVGSYNGAAAPISTTGSNFVVLSDGDANIVASTKTGQTFALPGGTLSSGTGIAFPATQSASTDANTLDDYEEGTYTPTFTSMTVNSGSAVYSGKYTKIGNLCYAMFGTTGTQNVTAVAGTTQFSLPFVSSGINFSAGLGSAPGLAQNGNTTATSGLQGPTNGGSGGYFIQGLAATTSIVGSVTYHTA